MSDARQQRLQEAMRKSLSRLRRLTSLEELRLLAQGENPAFVIFTTHDCDYCANALYNVADLSARYAAAVQFCWATMEKNHDIVLNYAVNEFPSALVLRRDAPPERVKGRSLADPQSTRRILDAASR